jgi:hypothetical protein
MINTCGKTNLLQRAQSLYSILRSVYPVLQGEKTAYKNSILGFVLIMTLGRLLMPAYPVRASIPTPTQTEYVMVVVHLLDASDQPLVGVTVNLVLNRYGDIIEEIQAGTCVMDPTGSCSITIADPPCLRSGKIEGFIDLGEYGRQFIGWKGDSFEITLQLYPDGKLATLPVPLDGPYEGQTEQPTDAPLSTPTSAPKTSVTPSATATVFLNTTTPVPPTATLTTLATATFTPQLTLPTLSTSPTPIPLSHPHERSGWVWIGLGLALFAGLGTSFAIYYHRQHMPRQSD